MLVNDAARQSVVDTLRNVLGSSEDARIVLHPVEAVLPRGSDSGDREKPGAGSGTWTREELYDRIQRGAPVSTVPACCSWRCPPWWRRSD